MSAKHTKGPWKALPIQYGGLPYAPVMAKTLLAKVYSEAFGDHDECEANARRIVACVNACDGLDTELLENITTMGDTLASRFKMRDQVEREREAQRDELLEVLKICEHVLRDEGCTYTAGVAKDVIDEVESNIAKVESGAA